MGSGNGTAVSAYTFVMNFPFAPALGRRHFSAALFLTTLSLSIGSRAAGDPDAVTLETARADLEAGRVVLIDVREPSEHATGVAAGARLLPMSQLSARVGEIPLDARRNRCI